MRRLCFFIIMVSVLLCTVGHAEVNTVVIPDPAKKGPAVVVVPKQEEVVQPKATPVPSFYNPFMSFLGTAKGLVSSVSAVGGLILFVLAAVGYVRYLQNPQQHHLSSVFGALMFGGVLFGLAYLQEPKLNKPVQSSKVNKATRPSKNKNEVPVL